MSKKDSKKTTKEDVQDDTKVNLNEKKTEKELDADIKENSEEQKEEQQEEEKEAENIMENFRLILEAQKKQQEEEIIKLKRENLISLEQQKKQYLLEIENTKNFVLQKFVQDMLIVIDSLGAGIEAKPDNYEKFIDGITMTYNIFLKVLEKYNVKKIDVKIGDEFNERYHECLSTDGEGSSIVQILTKGYEYNDRVLRAAQVIVGKK